MGKAFRRIGSRSSGSVAFEAVDVLKFLLGTLTRLKAIIDTHKEVATSQVLRALFDTLSRELDDAFFEKRMVIYTNSADPRCSSSRNWGGRNKAVEYVLRKSLPPQDSWLTYAFASRSEGYSYRPSA